MDIKTFLAQSKHKKLPWVTILTHVSYQPRILSAVLAFLRNSYPVVTVSLCNIQYNSVAAELSSSFLGQARLFWLADVDVVDSAYIQKLIAFFVAYKGPHTIVCFIPHKAITLFNTGKKIDQVNFDGPYSMCDVECLAQDDSNAVSFDWLPDMRKKYKQLSLEQVLMLTQYYRILGKNRETFNNQWLVHILEPEQSLFMLCQYLFSKQARQFLSLWKSVKDSYTPSFWLAFWSDQVWRAYFFIFLRSSSKAQQIKEISVRLPFGFVRHDWKKIKPNELLHAHEFLYDADVKIKMGSSDIFLDVFVFRFLSGNFVIS